MNYRDWALEPFSVPVFLLWGLSFYMSKRFTDTEKWKKPFIRGLQGAYKLLWIYITDDCDHAGIWQVDIQIASIKIGEIIDEKKAIETFGDKIHVFHNGEKWFIPDFLDFQYGKLNPKNRVHESVINQLEKYNLMGLISPLQGRKDKDKDKDINKEKEKSEKPNLSNSDPLVFYDMKKVEAEMLNSETWQEDILRLNPSLNSNRLKKEISTFCLEQKASGNESKCVAEYKRHFVKWIAYKLKSENNGIKPSAPSRPANVQKYIDQLAEKEK